MGTAAELNHFLADVEKRAFAMARMSVGNADDALDIVQDVMMTLARRYSDKPAGEWRPLFYRMLRNRITDFHRKQSLRGRLFGWFQASEDGADDLENAPGSGVETPDRKLASLQLGERIELALTALPDRQREAFVLRAWEGLDVRATAAAMGCSEGSVKTHYSRAVHQLREVLEDMTDG